MEPQKVIVMDGLAGIRQCEGTDITLQEEGIVEGPFSNTTVIDADTLH